MACSEPKISLRLQANRICYLSREARFDLVVFITISSDQPVTILAHSNERDAGLLVSHLIEVFDSESKEKVPVLCSDLDQEQKDLSSKGDPPSLLTLYDKRTAYLSFTTARVRKPYELVFDVSHLRPDREYTVRCHAGGLDWWSRESQEDILHYFDIYHELPLTEETPASLQCAPVNRVTFRTCQDVPPAAPQITVSLSAPSSTCSVSGDAPPFTFAITFTSQHTDGPVTVLAERNAVKASCSDIEIREASSGKRVAPDLIDVNDDGGPWRAEDFLRLEPGVPYVERREWRPGGADGGLEELEVGGEYVMRVLDGKWWWSFDGVEEVMGYAGERSDGSLPFVPWVELVCGDEVRFWVV